jgi:hypothetical protein
MWSDQSLFFRPKTARFFEKMRSVRKSTLSDVLTILPVVSVIIDVFIAAEPRSCASVQFLE